MTPATILWVDDEIEMLVPHLLFLEGKGYKVVTVNNGHDACDIAERQNFDIVFLDEQMPGMSGMDTLNRIRTKQPHLPVVMVTKSEEENIMEDAIGSQISDYLIKPVKPQQLLLVLKKHLENKRIISEKNITEYQKEFRNISLQLNENMDFRAWIELYKKLVHWELNLGESDETGMREILQNQKTEANRLFGRFIEKNYLHWLHGKTADIPVLSCRLLKEKIFPLLSDNAPVFFILIDNLRFDQWKTLELRFTEYFHVDSEEIYFSILPTTTQYARNALFSGLMPSELERRYPDMWLDEEDEGSKNVYEAELLSELLSRNNIAIKSSYSKIVHQQEGNKLAESVSNLFGNKLNVIVYNFVDILSHARTEVAVVRELAYDEAAYRAITLSWFEHSSLLGIIKQLAAKKCRVVITTDHGSVRVTKPTKVIGTREITANLRYKTGQNMQYEKRDVIEVRSPADAYLPKRNLNSAYIFAKEDMFFAYPNNFNHYVKHYQNTFQHGGASMEEMMVPVVTMSPK